MVRQEKGSREVCRSHGADSASGTSTQRQPLEIAERQMHRVLDPLPVGEGIKQAFARPKWVRLAVASTAFRRASLGRSSGWRSGQCSDAAFSSSGPTLLVETGRSLVGIGFAVPSTTVKPAIEQLKQKGVVSRGSLGVEVQPLTPDVAAALGLKQPEGALIAEIQPDDTTMLTGIRSRCSRSVDYIVDYICDRPMQEVSPVAT